MSQTLRRYTVALIASAMLMALAASSAQAAPTASFTVSDPPRVNGSPVTFTSTSTAPDPFVITATEWDFGYDGVTFNVEATGTPVQQTFGTPGTYNVAVRVTSNEPANNQSIAAQSITITQANRAPTSAFSWGPVQPLVGQTIQFASNATDPDNDNLDHVWNFGGGVTSTLRNPTHPYSTPGTKTVTLRVTDPSGLSHTSTRQVVVSGPPVVFPNPNQVPIANFAFGPRTPRVGDPVEFVSTAVDPDGEVRGLTWDLDGDGQFDDARGSEVVYTYLTPGEKQVRLRVEDAAASAAVQQRAVNVLPAPTPPPGFLRPSPKVRLNGLILTRGMRVRILGVQAPRGAIVTVRCRGKACPVDQRRKRVKRSSVRFHSFERFLRGGVRLEIYVRKPKTIGSYTRYTIRAGKGPRIIDRCLPAGASTEPKRRCG